MDVPHPGAPRVVSIRRRLDQGERAQQSLRHDFACLVVALELPVLVAELEHDSRLAHRVGHREDLVERTGHALLAVHVLPGLCGRDRDRGVPVVRRGDDHGVHVRAREQFLVVAVPLRRFQRPGVLARSERLCGGGDRPLRTYVEHVAHGRELDVQVLLGQPLREPAVPRILRHRLAPSLDPVRVREPDAADQRFSLAAVADDPDADRLAVLADRFFRERRRFELDLDFVRDRIALRVLNRRLADRLVAESPGERHRGQRLDHVPPVHAPRRGFISTGVGNRNGLVQPPMRHPSHLPVPRARAGRSRRSCLRPSGSRRSSLSSGRARPPDQPIQADEPSRREEKGDEQGEQFNQVLVDDDVRALLGNAYSRPTHGGVAK